MAEDVRIRPADPSERPAVANVLDGAALEVDEALLEDALAVGDALVAVAVADESDGTSDSSRVLGALILDGDEIVAVAVRRRRRDQGIGTALVDAAEDRRDRLVAECDAGVRPFWASLGFEIAPTANGRFVCVR